MGKRSKLGPESDWEIVLRPSKLGPRDPTPEQRVRRLLKIALRGLDLKVVSYRWLHPDPDTDTCKHEPPFAPQLERKP